MKVILESRNYAEQIVALESYPLIMGSALLFHLFAISNGISLIMAT